jgi:hypothetical protein
MIHLPAHQNNNISVSIIHTIKGTYILITRVCCLLVTLFVLPTLSVIKIIY